MPIQGPIPFPPKKPRTRRGPRLRWPLFLLFALLLLVSGLGAWAVCDWTLLVRDTPNARARWALTLAGEGSEADRIQAGLALLASSRADSLVLSGTPIVSGLHTSTVLLSRLAPELESRRRILELRHESRSTAEEAQALIPLLHSFGADTVLLVTSSYHTRRAASIFNDIAPTGMVFLPVSAPNPIFAKGWGDREAAKLWILEWSKTLWWHLVDRWSTLPLRPDRAWSARFPEAGKLGETCPAPEPQACPAPPPCPEPAPAVEPPAAPKPERKPEPKASVREDKPKSKDKSKAVKEKASTKDTKKAKEKEKKR